MIAVSFDFYLGTHMPAWLETSDRPLFVSHRRLAGRKRLPRAACRWALDSGGFTELSMYGRWNVAAASYATSVRRYRDEIGRLDWAAPQDWMCEPRIIAKTGLSVAEHQRRTVENLLELRSIAPDLPWVPVLQGWTLADYRACVDLYGSAGVDLAAELVVGLGSVCRRQATSEIGEIVASLDGISLHGFGVKRDGLRRYGWMLASADSLAWSYSGRRIRPCPRRAVKSCANCWHYARDWAEAVTAPLAPRPVQMVLS